MSNETKRYQCRHIFTDGHRCGSPCLRREEFCYYHHTTRRPIQNPRERRSQQAQFDLPLPEDRSAIQCSIGEVLRRVARNEIDSKRAGLLLYGLQIASLNLPRNVEPKRDSTPVEEITADPQLGTLAPRAEVLVPQPRVSVIGALLQKLTEEHTAATRPAEAESAGPPNAPAGEPTVLPDIQASNDSAQTHRKILPRRQYHQRRGSSNAQSLGRHRYQRNMSPHTRSSAHRGVDRECATEQVDSLAHADQPKTHASPHSLNVKPCAIILNAKGKLVRCTGHLNLN
jgi:hypothetical protein